MAYAANWIFLALVLVCIIAGIVCICLDERDRRRNEQILPIARNAVGTNISSHGQAHESGYGTIQQQEDWGSDGEYGRFRDSAEDYHHEDHSHF